MAPWTAAAAGLLAGVRLAGVVFMLPLVGWAMLRACRGNRRAWAASALAGLGALAAWYVPAAIRGGGPIEFLGYHSGLSHFLVVECSVLYRPDVAVHLQRAMQVTLWTAMALAAPRRSGRACVWWLRSGTRRHVGQIANLPWCVGQIANLPWCVGQIANLPWCVAGWQPARHYAPSASGMVRNGG